MDLYHQLINHLLAEQLWEKSLVLNRGDILCPSGEVETKIYFVKNGSLRVSFFDDNRDHTVRLAYSGDLITRLDSFISGQPSELSIESLKRSEVLVMSKTAYNQWIQAQPERVDAWMQILEQLIYQQLERELDLLIESPSERLNRVLKRSPNLFQEIPLKYIASYLRMTPETLSRLRKS